MATQAWVQGRDAGSVQAVATSFEPFTRGRPVAHDFSERPAPGTPRAPVAVFGFDALTDPLSFPADPTGALGDTYFVTAVNTYAGVYDRAGTEVVAPIPLDDLHLDSVGRFAFDPKVVYDQYADTFVLVYLVQEDSPRLSLIVTVAIPNATAADQSTWCPTAFPGDLLDEAPALWADYPAVGFDEGRVTIATNQFTFPSSRGRFRYAQVLSIPKASLYDCGAEPPVADVFAGTQTRDPNGIQSRTLQPAQTIGSPAAQQLMLSVQLAGRRSYLVIWRVKTTVSGPRLRKATVPIGRTKFPVAGTQGGGSLEDSDTYWDTGDDRLINAFHDVTRNELFAAHAVLRDFKPDVLTAGYPESAVRWYEVNPGLTLTDSVLARKGTFGGVEVDLGWPTVATDGTGNLFVTYSRASQPAGEFLSAWVAEIGPESTTATQQLLAPGLATYDVINGIERWGDFTGINRDPLDPSILATFNQYALDPANWQQVVHTVRHG